MSHQWILICILLNVFHCKYFYVVTSSWGPGSTGLPGERVASVSYNLEVIRPPQSVGHDSQCKSAHTNKMWPTLNSKNTVSICAYEARQLVRSVAVQRSMFLKRQVYYSTYLHAMWNWACFKSDQFQTLFWVGKGSRFAGY